MNEINFPNIKRYTLIFKEETYENGKLIDQEEPIKIEMQSINSEMNIYGFPYSELKQRTDHLKECYNKLEEEIIMKGDY